MKKLNKFFAVLVALAMMATLCVSMAFATAGDDITPTTDAQKSADALLVKYLEVPNGTTAPTKEFTFNFAGIASATITEAEANAAKPTTAVTLTPTTPTNFNGDENTVAAVQKLKDLNWNFAAGPGEYIYRVTEVLPTENMTGNVETLTAADKVEKYTYDQNSYIVRLYVDNSGQIKNITVIDEDKTPAAKENATNNPIIENGSTSDNFEGTGLSFLNKYTKTKITPADDTNGVMKVTKTVTGNMGSLTQTFPFTITLTAPTTEDASAPVQYVDEAGATQTTAFTNGSLTITGDLKSGDSIKFIKLPVGTTYTVSENLAATTIKNNDKYTPKYQIDSAEEVSGSPATALTTASTDVNDAANNLVAFTNAFDDSQAEPEGILISNLPYIALALVAIGGLVAYVVVRRRNADEA